MVKTYVKGESVLVLTPSGGKVPGVVMEVLHNYGFNGRQETKYRVSGKDIETITSERCLESICLT